MRRRIAGTIWLFLFVLAASAGGIAILGSAASRGTHFEPYSTFRAEGDGASALYDTLAGSGFECRRETEELVDLPDDGSLVVLLHPYARSEIASVATESVISPREVDRLLGWVKRGGRLLVLESLENPLYDALGIKVEGLPTVQEQPVATARPAALSTITARGGRLALACHASVSSDHGAWSALFVDGSGRPVVLARDWGDGRVLAISDPSIATNDGIGRASHLDVLVDIASDSPKKVRLVRFDELRHGFHSERNVMGFARRYGLHVVLVQAGLTFVLAIWAAARPRRRLRGEGLEKGIESREFISAMANIYARARLERHAIASYKRRCERAIALAIGASPTSLPRAEVATRLRAIGVQNYQGWEAVQDESTVLFARTGSVGEHRLVSFARLATQLEREVREAARLTVDQVTG